MSARSVAAAALGAVAAVVLAGCSLVPTVSTPATATATAPVTDRWASLTADGQAVTCVRVLATSEFQKGLSGSTPSPYGAVFEFGSATPSAFWMRGTAGHLVLYWLNPAGSVLARVVMDPESLRAWPPPAGATEAVELPPALSPDRKVTTMSLGGTCDGG